MLLLASVLAAKGVVYWALNISILFYIFVSATMRLFKAVSIEIINIYMYWGTDAHLASCPKELYSFSLLKNCWVVKFVVWFSIVLWFESVKHLKLQKNMILFKSINFQEALKFIILKVHNFGNVPNSKIMMVHFAPSYHILVTLPFSLYNSHCPVELLNGYEYTTHFKRIFPNGVLMDNFTVWKAIWEVWSVHVMFNS